MNLKVREISLILNKIHNLEDSYYHFIYKGKYLPNIKHKREFKPDFWYFAGGIHYPRVFGPFESEEKAFKAKEDLTRFYRKSLNEALEENNVTEDEILNYKYTEEDMFVMAQPYA